MVAGLAQAWLVARLLAALLVGGNAGWPELGAAAALALLMAGLGVAQERAQLAAADGAKARLRRALFARLLALGPADERPVGERSALVVERVEAMGGYFGRWVPSAVLAVTGPLVVAGAAALVDPVTGAILLGCGLLVPVAMALTGIGAAQASRRQFDALGRLSGRFLDRMRGLPTLVLFNRQEAEAASLGAAADELRQRDDARAAAGLPGRRRDGTAGGCRHRARRDPSCRVLPGDDGRPGAGALRPAAGAAFLRAAPCLLGGLSRPAFGPGRGGGAGAPAGARRG